MRTFKYKDYDITVHTEPKYNLNSMDNLLYDKVIPIEVPLLLHAGVELAVNLFKAKKIYLEAQEYAKGYYAREGFEVVSEPFLEDGIPHVKMEKII